MIKYRVDYYIYKIDRINIERETSHSIIYENGRKDRKVSKYLSYHDTFEDAKLFLMNVITIQKMKLEKEIDNINNKLNKIEQLKEVDLSCH